MKIGKDETTAATATAAGKLTGVAKLTAIAVTINAPRRSCHLRVEASSWGLIRT